MFTQIPVFKKVFEFGEEQVGKLAQQLMSNEMFVNAIQAVVSNSLKAKGVLDKNMGLALSAMNLPTLSEVENLKKKLEELEQTIARLEDTVNKSASK